MEWINDSTFPTVRFTAEEMADLRKLAKMRNDPRKKKGFVNDRQDRTFSHLLGVMGESAVASWFGVKMDTRFLIKGDGNISDLNIDGRSVQVKSTSNFRGDLIYNSPDHFQSDIAVLVHANAEHAYCQLKGWCEREAFLRHCAFTDYGFGKRAYMPALLLEDVYDLPRTQKIPDQLKDVYFERAAISEFDGKQDRLKAEIYAYKWIVNKLKNGEIDR